MIAFRASGDIAPSLFGDVLRGGEKS